MSNNLQFLPASQDEPWWPKPRHRDFAPIGGDTDVYREVLEILACEPFLTAEKLLSPEQGLRNRFRKLVLIQTPTKTNVRGMLTLLERFGWVRADEKSRFTITPIGKDVLANSSNDVKQFRRAFAGNLHYCYIVPGWFVHRLHELNPKGQGEIVLPAPPRMPGVGRKEWSDRDWPKQLNEVVKEVGKNANKVVPGAFPIHPDEWLEKVIQVWCRLGAGSPPRNRLATSEKNTYAVRERLFHSMREASIELLFGIVNPLDHSVDFSSGSQPISYRAFSVWCPRLSAGGCD